MLTLHVCWKQSTEELYNVQKTKGKVSIIHNKLLYGIKNKEVPEFKSCVTCILLPDGVALFAQHERIALSKKSSNFCSIDSGSSVILSILIPLDVHKIYSNYCFFVVLSVP